MWHAICWSKPRTQAHSKQAQSWLGPERTRKRKTIETTPPLLSCCCCSCVVVSHHMCTCTQLATLTLYFTFLVVKWKSNGAIHVTMGFQPNGFRLWLELKSSLLESSFPFPDSNRKYIFVPESLALWLYLAVDNANDHTGLPSWGQIWVGAKEIRTFKGLSSNQK